MGRIDAGAWGIAWRKPPGIGSRSNPKTYGRFTIYDNASIQIVSKFDEWLKEVAPSAELHQRFGSHPNVAKWAEFEQCYRTELQEKHKSIDFLHQKSKEGVLTLIHAAHDEDHSSAGVLKRFLEETAQHSDSE